MNSKTLARTIGPMLVFTVLSTGVASATEYVVNGDFSAGNTGFTTDYTFVATGQETVPGEYGVRTDSQDFNQYYDEFHDHTTGTGNMMLVDGSPNGSSATVWSETVAVPANTAFNFSAWASPADPPNPATLQISINGVMLPTEFDLTTTVEFQNYTQSWNSGSATSALITIVDTNTEAYQGNGNDFALDDISLVNVVPEPGACVFFGIGSVLLTGSLMRRRKRGTGGGLGLPAGRGTD